MDNRSLREKVAYLQGLANGLALNDSTSEGKILLGILDILEQMSATVSELTINLDELEDYVDSIDEDLSALEDNDEEDDFVEIVCPHCGETVYFDPDMLDDEEELLCPSCGKMLLEDNGEQLS